MRTPVQTVVRDHLRSNDAAQETIEWAEIVARVEGSQVPESHRKHLEQHINRNRARLGLEPTRVR